jgi:hypothetical protein
MEAMSSSSPHKHAPPPKDAGKNAPSKDAPIRKELVERVRREIAEGTYDTPEKWDAALDRLFKRLEEK